MEKTNLELKHYCSDFDKIREVLKWLGATKDIVKQQKDYFFNLPANSSGRLKLRIEGNNETLIYYERPDFVKGRATTADVKLYEVRDSQLLGFLTEVLGIKAVVEKKREVWRKSNTVFHLDNVKDVGNIFEIELQKKGKISALDTKQFRDYQDQLIPYLGEVIEGSNADLVPSKV